jgi:hypothetical protein
MPRSTRRQLVGKQEDILRQEREDALRALEQELHRSWHSLATFITSRELEPTPLEYGLLEAIPVLLTVHS